MQQDPHKLRAKSVKSETVSTVDATAGKLNSEKLNRKQSCSYRLQHSAVSRFSVEDFLKLL